MSALADAGLVERFHADNERRSRAVFSACGAYRYLLEREWDAAGPRLVYVMLNPSTADETRNDPTIERCERRARSLGYGAMRAVNIFAFRATDPAELVMAREPEGPQNAAALEEACDWGHMVLAAWGVHGTHLGQGGKVEAMLRRKARKLCHFGLTRHGHPRHPLYVGYAIKPRPWSE